MKKLPILLIIMILFSECSSSGYYFRIRAEGKIQKEEKNRHCSQKKDSVPEIFYPTEIPNDDTCVFLKKEGEKQLIISNYEIAESSSEQYLSDTVKINDTTSFVIDDELSQAFASPFVNGLAALFGALSLANPGFVWIAAPMYIAVPIIGLIGIICFFVALARYSTGKSDRRNKKYFWIWLLAFVVSLAVAAMILMMIF